MSIILPNFAFANGVGQSLRVPETFDEAFSFLWRVIEPLPKAVGGVWQEAVGIWKRMADWFINLWNSHIWPKIEWIWQKVAAIFGKEIEKRKEIIPQELEKEKQELKEEAEKAGKSLWERFKGIIFKKENKD